MVPNIFGYATKELSQDALICWLVACARQSEGKLRELGIDFVQALMRSGKRTAIDVRDRESRPYEGGCEVVEVLCEPKQQYGKIDVYFQATVDGKTVSFLIEDKTQTEMHGDQLERYRRLVTDDNQREDLVKAVYLKTGYVFDDERESAESNAYSVFEGADMLSFLSEDERADTNEIVRQYVEYLRGQLDDRRSALKSWNLDEGFVQWEFMVRLGQVLRLSGNKWPARWFNIGGGAWTQYPHWEDRGALFWRLDSWKPLRLMVDTSKAGDDALERWDGWSRSFEDARIEAGLRPAKFRSVKSRNGTVVREGTVGAVNIACCLRREGLDASVERVRRLHRAFMTSLEEDGLC